MTDVVVVGGGPVGAVTALLAARAGMSVTVVEPRTSPVDKACGEGILPSGARILRDLGIEPTGAPIVGIRYVRDDREAVARFRRGQGLGVRRTELQERCRLAALSAGVDWVTDRVGGLSQDDEGVILHLVGGGDLRAGWVVGADGLHSTVRRHVARRVGRGPGVARFGMVRHTSALPPTSLVSVHWTDRGEAYVTPLGDGTSGVAVLARSGGRDEDVLAAVPELVPVLDDDGLTRPRGAGPLWQLPDRRVRGRVLLVGDAAGYVDAVTGEGLSSGFAQAEMAVAALLRGDPRRYAADYWRVSGRPLALTAALVTATRSGRVRRAIVPAAERAGGLFRAAVDLAGGAG